ncbi:hypothetical protein K8T06_17810 [bacterium]|nr:hypothetical protein [bacterium]
MKELKTILLVIILIPLMLIVQNVKAVDNSAYFNDNEMLRNRFYSYMSLRKVADFKAMYEMLSAKYRKEVTFDQFMSMPTDPTRTLMAYYLDAIEMENGKGVVYYFEFSMIPGVPSPHMRTNIMQHWVKEADEWFYDREIKVIEKKPLHCGASSQMNTTDNSNKSAPPACGSRK